MKNIIFIASLLYGYLALSQTLVYTVSAKNQQLGKLIVERTQIDSTYQIEVNSDVNFKLFINISLKYKLICTYSNNELQFSSVKTYVNDKLKSSLKTEKKNQYYQVTKNGKDSKYLKSIGLSGALSYFIEPNHFKTLYSDFYGYDKNIEKISEHVYKITNPKNGQISEYFYENGILNKALIHHLLLTFKIELVQTMDGKTI